MSRLDWIRNEDGWRAGPYEIELAAPGLWVCSSRRGPERFRIESTSGSLSALKTRVEKLHQRRKATRRAYINLIAAILSMLIVALGANWSHGGAAAIVVFLFGVAALVFTMRAIDAVVLRSWESLRLTYQ